MRSRHVLQDFILANQDLNYFETAQDKVRFFCDQLGIPKESLPAKVYEGGPESKPSLRYFFDKFPLFLAAPFLVPRPWSHSVMWIPAREACGVLSRISPRTKDSSAT